MDDDTVIDVYSILSLLHYRGLVDNVNNREDVERVMKKVQPFARAAEMRVMRRREELGQ